MTNKPGTLFLLPNLLGAELDHQQFFPSAVDQIVGEIDGLIAESETGARRYLGRFKENNKVKNIPIAIYDKHHRKPEDIEFFLEPVIAGESWGVISDAGMCCIADPGAELVAYARKKGVKIKPIVGPSSIFLSLILSGLPSQRFSFHGYLNREQKELREEIKRIEETSRREDGTHLFIEAPHRNEALLEALLETLSPGTLLSIAVNLTQKKEFVDTQSVETWRRMALPNLNKKPTVFLVYSGKRF